jgi:hypothetical protein
LLGWPSLAIACVRQNPPNPPQVDRPLSWRKVVGGPLPTGPGAHRPEQKRLIRAWPKVGR